MIEPRDPHSKLLAETFHGDWSGGVAGRFALRAAAHARRQRTLRRALAVAGASAVVAVVAFFTRSEPPAVRAPITRASELKQTAPARGYEVISDEELLSQLRDRPLLVVKTQTGGKQFVLLETTPN
jgi:hypothetical protein